MNITQWNKTPYANSKSKNSFSHITSILDKYECDNMQFSRGQIPGGRKAVVLRFQLGNRPYRILIETLNAPEVDDKTLMRQAERAVFHTVKNALELASVFTSVEKALFIFMELGDGGTIFELENEKINAIAREPKDFGLALAPAPADIIDAEVE